MTTVEDVIVFIDNADATTLEQIRSAASLRQYRIKKGMTPDGEGDDEIAAESANVSFVLYDGIKDSYKARVGQPLPPLSVLQTTMPALYKKYRDAESLVADYCKQNELDELSQGEQYHLFYLFGEVIISRLANADIPVTLSTVVKGLDKIPAYMDREFPGYARAGVLKAIIQKKRIDVF